MSRTAKIANFSEILEGLSIFVRYWNESFGE